MARKIDERPTPQLPPGIISVADIAGPISVATVRSKCESAIAVFLQSQGIDFYNPRQHVVSYYAGRRRAWSRAMFPGILFVGNGYAGRMACELYGHMFRDQLRGYIGHVAERENAVTQQLRDELAKTERMLGIDPQLESVTGLVRGRRVRVDHPHDFEGYEGVIEGDGGDGRVYVVLPLLQTSASIRVPRDMLTLLD